MKVLYRLLSYAKIYRWQFLGILILGIFSSSLQPGAALAVKPLLESLVGRSGSGKTLIPIVIMIFTIFCAISRYYYEVWAGYLSEKMIRTIRHELFKKYLSLSLDYYSEASTGKLMTTVSSDVVLLLEGLNRITVLLRDPFTILGLLVVAFYRDWQLSLLSLALLPPLVILVSYVGRKLRRMTHKRQDYWATLNSTLHETLSGIRIIKAFNLEKVLEKRFSDDSQRVIQVQYGYLKIENLMPSMLILAGGLGVAFLYGYRGTTDVLTVGVALGLLFDPIKKINGLYTGFQKALGGADRVFAMLDVQPSVLERKNALEIKSFQKSISFEAVSFKYKEDHEWILKNVSLTVHKGDVVALVGSSGGGKTTFVNLIPRFYDVTQGRILINGEDIRNLTLSSLRGQIALVSQDIFLFNDTLESNIAYGDPSQSRDEIIEAAKAANAHEFIMELPEQYETLIGERGVKLSGGQRQRISIARALLKNAPILILDEATSALDTESEILVQKAIEELMKGRTSFIIAHRLSTIQHASRILVLAEGRIAEEGTHESLMEKEGLYYKFYQLQFSKQLSMGQLKKHEGQSWL